MGSSPTIYGEKLYCIFHVILQFLEVEKTYNLQSITVNLIPRIPCISFQIVCLLFLLIFILSVLYITVVCYI